MTSLPPLLTTDEVAAECRVHPETVRRWAKDGRLPVIELPSGMLRFRRSDIERLLSTTTPGAAATPRTVAS